MHRVIQNQVEKLKRFAKLSCKGHCLLDFPKYYISKSYNKPKLRRKLRLQDYIDGWRWCRTCECGIPPSIISLFCVCCGRKLQFMPSSIKYREDFVTRY